MPRRALLASVLMLAAPGQLRAEPEENSVASPSHSGRPPSRALPTVLIAVGGMTMIGGAFGIAFDQDPSPSLGNTILNTAPVGTAALAAGTLITGVGGYLYWRAGRDAPPSNGSRSWMRWAGFGAIGVAAIAGGVGFKFARDAHDAGSEIDRVCAVSCTSQQASDLENKQSTANRNALISGGAGAAVLITGTVLLVLSLQDQDRGHGMPTASISGAGATIGWAASF